MKVKKIHIQKKEKQGAHKHTETKPFIHLTEQPVNSVANYPPNAQHQQH